MNHHGTKESTIKEITEIKELEELKKSIKNKKKRWPRRLWRLVIKHATIH